MNKTESKPSPFDWKNKPSEFSKDNGFIKPVVRKRPLNVEYSNKYTASAYSHRNPKVKI